MNMKITIEFEQKPMIELDSLIEEAIKVKEDCNKTMKTYASAINEVGIKKVKAIKEELEPFVDTIKKLEELCGQKNIAVSEHYKVDRFSTKSVSVYINSNGEIRIGESNSRYPIDAIIDGKYNTYSVLFGEYGAITIWNEYRFVALIEEQIKNIISREVERNVNKTKETERTFCNMVEK